MPTAPPSRSGPATSPEASVVNSEDRPDTGARPSKETELGPGASLVRDAEALLFGPSTRCLPESNSDRDADRAPLQVGSSDVA